MFTKFPLRPVNRSSSGRSSSAAVAVHRLEPALEYGARLDFVPVMQHQPVLHRAADFFGSARYHLLFVVVYSLGQRESSAVTAKYGLQLP